MGGEQTEQPAFGKEQFGPALVIATATIAAQVNATAEDASQTAADEAVHVGEDIRIRAVLAESVV